MEQSRFGIYKTITNQKRISGFRWWLFGGAINYKPPLKDSGKIYVPFLIGERSPTLWGKLYYRYIQHRRPLKNIFLSLIDDFKNLSFINWVVNNLRMRKRPV